MHDRHYNYYTGKRKRVKKSQNKHTDYSERFLKGKLLVA